MAEIQVGPIHHMAVTVDEVIGERRSMMHVLQCRLILLKSFYL